MNGVICLKDWSFTGSEKEGVEEERMLAFTAFLPVRDHKNLNGLLALMSIDSTDIFNKRPQQNDGLLSTAPLTKQIFTLSSWYPSHVMLA